MFELIPEIEPIAEPTPNLILEESLLEPIAEPIPEPQILHNELEFETTEILFSNE